MAAPARSTDDAPTTPIARADLRRAAAPRRRVLPFVAAGVAVLLVVAAATVLALRDGPSPEPASPATAAAAGPSTAPTSPTPAPVPVGGVLFSFTGSPNGQAHVAADGAVVAVLDDVSTTPGRSSTQLVTYDQGTGAQLSTAGRGLPEPTTMRGRAVRVRADARRG